MSARFPPTASPALPAPAGAGNRANRLSNQGRLRAQSLLRRLKASDDARFLRLTDAVQDRAWRLDDSRNLTAALRAWGHTVRLLQAEPNASPARATQIGKHWCGEMHLLTRSCEQMPGDREPENRLNVHRLMGSFAPRVGGRGQFRRIATFSFHTIARFFERARFDRQPPTPENALAEFRRAGRGASILLNALFSAHADGREWFDRPIALPLETGVFLGHIRGSHSLDVAVRHHSIFFEMRTFVAWSNGIRRRSEGLFSLLDDLHALDEHVPASVLFPMQADLLGVRVETLLARSLLHGAHPDRRRSAELSRILLERLTGSPADHPHVSETRNIAGTEHNPAARDPLHQALGSKRLPISTRSTLLAGVCHAPVQLLGRT